MPGRRHILLGEYLRSWKKLAALHPDAVALRRMVNGWEWYPISAGEILGKISYGVHDRINRHLPWFQTLYKYNPDCPRRETRRRDKLHSLVARGLLKCECRWCGSALPLEWRLTARLTSDVELC